MKQIRTIKLLWIIQLQRIIKRRIKPFQVIKRLTKQWATLLQIKPRQTIRRKIQLRSQWIKQTWHQATKLPLWIWLKIKHCQIILPKMWQHPIIKQVISVWLPIKQSIIRLRMLLKIILVVRIQHPMLQRIIQILQIKQQITCLLIILNQITKHKMRTIMPHKTVLMRQRH